MKIVTVIARILLALPFLIFGIMWFVTHPEEQQDFPAAAEQFLGALDASPYMWPVVKAVEVVSGALLLIGRWVPLALVILAPVLVNIVLFHLFLDSRGNVMALPLAGLHGFLVYRYRDSFKGVLAAKP